MARFFVTLGFHLSFRCHNCFGECHHLPSRSQAACLQPIDPTTRSDDQFTLLYAYMLPLRSLQTVTAAVFAVVGPGMVKLGTALSVPRHSLERPHVAPLVCVFQGHLVNLPTRIWEPTHPTHIHMFVTFWIH
jgi:hypothetical protein